MCGSMVDIQCATAENRRGKKDRRKKKLGSRDDPISDRRGYSGVPCSFIQAYIDTGTRQKLPILTYATCTQCPH